MPPEAAGPIVVVGRGRVGRSLASALDAAGGPVSLRPGSERLVALAGLLGARPRRVRDAERTAYHAAAAMAANLLVALADQSSQVLQRTGWSAADALDAVTSLMRGSLDALAAVGVPAALSGP